MTKMKLWIQDYLKINAEKYYQNDNKKMQRSSNWTWRSKT